MTHNVNTGIYFTKQPEYREEAKTFVVTGVPRSGTTGVMRLLEALGLYIDYDNPRNMESNKYSAPFVDLVCKPEFAARLKDNSSRWGDWAFKAHDLSHQTVFFDRAESYFAQVVNPVIIIPTRDPMLQALRQQKDTPKLRFEPLYWDALTKWQKILGFLATTGLPVCLVSFEKLLVNPYTLELLLDWMYGEGNYEHPGFEWLRVDDPRYIDTE